MSKPECLLLFNVVDQNGFLSLVTIPILSFVLVKTSWELGHSLDCFSRPGGSVQPNVLQSGEWLNLLCDIPVKINIVLDLAIIMNAYQALFQGLLRANLYNLGVVPGLITFDIQLRWNLSNLVRPG